VVIVFRLNRFARSTRELVNWLDEFQALGVDFISLHESIDTTTPQGRLLYRIMAALSEFEVDIIKENVRSGLQHARNRGKRLGRPVLMNPATMSRTTIWRRAKQAQGCVAQ
jgi:DNA invertase Pin-like site-specific DNA recombinase